MMKYRFFLLAFLFCFVPVLSVAPANGADDASGVPRIDQRIAVDLDGGENAFYLFYTVKNGPRTLSDGTSLVLCTKDREFTVMAYGTLFSRERYTVPGDYFFYYDASDPLGRSYLEKSGARKIWDDKSDFELVWRSYSMGRGGRNPAEALSDDRRDRIFLAGEIDPTNRIYRRNRYGNDENALLLHIVQLFDGDPLTFALLALNRSGSEVDLSGASTLSIRFPGGKTSPELYPASEQNMLLRPGESKVVKIDLRKAIGEADGVSLSDFEYGISEVMWSVRMPDGSTRTRSRWFAKLEGEVAPYQETDEFRKLLADGKAFRENAALPLDLSLMASPDAGTGVEMPAYYKSGYMLDGAPESETFLGHGRIVPVLHGWNTRTYWLKWAWDPRKTRTEKDLLELTDRMMTFDLQRRTRTVCDLSQLENGILEFRELPFGEAPGAKYLEIDVKRGPDGEVLPGIEVGGIRCPAEYILRLHSGDPADGFVVVGDRMPPEMFKQVDMYPESLLKDAPEQSYGATREIHLALDRDTLRHGGFTPPYLFAAVRIGDHYGKIVMNDIPGVNFSGREGAAGKRIVSGYRYNLDVFLNRKPGERSLTKYRDTYPLTQSEILQVLQSIEYGRNVFDLCARQDKELDFNVDNGRLLLVAIFDPSLCDNSNGIPASQKIATKLSVVEFLLKNGGAEILETDAGVACAAAAVTRNNIDAFNLLLKYGYDLKRTDKSGRNVTDYVLDELEKPMPASSRGKTGFRTGRKLDPFFAEKLPEANLGLFRAVRKNDVAAVEKAVREKRGIEFINEMDKDHKKLLYYALAPEHPNPDIVRALLEGGAELSSVGSYLDVTTVLDFVVREKKNEVLPVLWEFRDRLSEEKWIWGFVRAAKVKNEEAFRFFLDHGFDPYVCLAPREAPALIVYLNGTKEMVDMLDRKGLKKPFWAAVKWNDLDLAKEYVTSGVDVNDGKMRLPVVAGPGVYEPYMDRMLFGSADGGIPLLAAVEAGNLEMTELLLQNGAFTKPEDYFSRKATYPIIPAVKSGNSAAMTELLLKYGFKPDYPKTPGDRDAERTSALFLALKTHHLKTARILVQYGARKDVTASRSFEHGFGNKTVTLHDYYIDDPLALEAMDDSKGILDFAEEYSRDALWYLSLPVTVPLAIWKFLNYKGGF